MTKEELEKEAYLYAKNSKDVQDFECGFDIAFKSYLAGAEPREKRIEALEKENAELKKQLGMSNKVYNDNLDYSHHIEGQLTKAKEIIKDLLSCLYSVEYDRLSDLEKAEQFLNSEVEK